MEILFDNKISRILGIYVSTAYSRRRDLWIDLMQVCDQNTPWALIGDFNCVLGAHEKKDGRPPLQILCEEFLAFTNMANFVHIHTWGRSTQGIIEEKEVDTLRYV